MKGSCGCGGGGSQGVLTAADLNRNPSRILTAADLNRNPSKILTAKDLNGSSKVLSAADLNRGSRILTAADLNRGGTGVLTAADLNRWREETERRERPFAKLPHIGIEDQPDCSWKPNIWQPVSYGKDHHGQKKFHTPGPPYPTIVLYPSQTQNGPILGNYQYPLIVFAHGQCASNPDIYESWVDTLAPLARAGFIVVIPKLPVIDLSWLHSYLQNGFDNRTEPAYAIWAFAEAPIRQLRSLLADSLHWMLDSSPYKASIQAESIGLAGHSEGAYAAAMLAAGDSPPIGEEPAFSAAPNVLAYASLSGFFNDFGYLRQNTYSPGVWFVETLRQLTTPSLFMIGAQGSGGEQGAPDEGESYDTGIFDWDNIKPSAKHGVIFNGGHAYDYLPVYQQPMPAQASAVTLQQDYWEGGGPATCPDAALGLAGTQGACPTNQWLLARDVLVAFFSKYLINDLPWPIVNSLLPPTTADLQNVSSALLEKFVSPECWQQHADAFADYMTGVTSFGSDPNAHCIASFYWSIKNPAEKGSLQLGPGAGSAIHTGITGAELKQKDFGVYPVLPQGGVFICRDGENSMYAMSSICTHQQCDLARFGWINNMKGIITCACHGSVYDATGKVYPKQPAQFDLQHYAVAVEGDELLVDMSEPVSANVRYFLK